MLPKPKKPKGYKPPKNPDAEMTEARAFDSPPKKEKKKKSKKKSKGRGMLQVDRKLTDKEWQSIARSMNDRRRPYAPRPRFSGVRAGYRRR